MRGACCGASCGMRAAVNNEHHGEFTMTDVRKVRPSAGAEWLLGAFGLLRRSPFGLGLLGALFGLLAVVLAMLTMSSPSLMLLQQLVMMLLGPLLVAGMVWAAREVDQGRSANPGHLLRGIQDGKATRLWATLLPQIAAGVAAVLLLFVVVGPGDLQKLVVAVEQASGQANPDPSLFAGMPLGKLMLWLVMALAIGILAGFFTFTAIPDMMFRDARAFDAMKRSFRACLANLPALVVFFVLLLIAALAISMLVQLVGFLVRLAAGDTAMLFVSQVLMMAVLMPLVTGSMYFAWKQMVAGQNDAAESARSEAVVEV